MRTAALTVALTLALASHVQAALTVTIPNVSFKFDSGVVAINIPVSGPDLVHNFDAFIQIGDGAGGGGGGGPAPHISYLGSPSEITNNFMSLNAHTFVEEGSDNYNVDVGEILNASGQNISVSTNGGLLITLLVDLTGLGGGSWPLIADATGINGAGDFASQPGGPITTTWINGSVSIVPEPSSIALGLFAAAALGVVVIRKRRACRAVVVPFPGLRNPDPG